MTERTHREPLLTTNDTAGLLGVSPATLKKWRRQRKGPPYVRLGGCIRYQHEDLKRFIANRLISHQ